MRGARIVCSLALELGAPAVATPEQIDIQFAWGGLALAGSLHLPSGAGPHPAVVMAQGSGPADRDSGGYFEPIRRTFLDRGIATFAFDKPGCGASTGDWRHYGLAGRADQTVAALDLTRNHAAVDPERVGIWGHSQGGWLVQMLAGRPIELAFAIASSAPTIGVQDQILYDVEHTLRDHDHGDRDVGDALALAPGTPPSGRRRGRLRVDLRAVARTGTPSIVVRELPSRRGRRRLAAPDAARQRALRSRLIAEPHRVPVPRHLRRPRPLAAAVARRRAIRRRARRRRQRRCDHHRLP
ncbi:alpha/beta hydrolase family protein [Ilumatobacter sp.]|uniref:alpha/beta hydrolase family protein n=1 Tax=Ilumatobacter sp. TaxID=1967498 RepID=UPI00345D418B